MRMVVLVLVAVLASAIADAGAQQPQTRDDRADLAPRFLSGRVVLRDGSTPPAPVQITVRRAPGAPAVWSGYTDKNGNFSCSALGTVIEANLAGFSVHEIKRNLRHERDFVIVLRPVSPGDGVSVSLMDLRAPAAARRAYRYGAAALTKKNWQAAERDFNKAIAVYPGYPSAWKDLGIALERQKRPSEAREAYRKALAADPRFLASYLQLAALALEESKWEDAAEIADKLVALKPYDYPAAYFYHAAAHFKLGQLDIARTSAQRAIEFDLAKQFPRSEYLLGTILAVEGNHAAALEHLREYVERAPKAEDAAQVREQIADLERKVAGIGEPKK